MQRRNTFDRETLVKIVKGAGIAGVGAILAFLITAIPGMELDPTLSMVLVAVMSTLFNALKEYRKGEVE